jgi:cytochrome c
MGRGISRFTAALIGLLGLLLAAVSWDLGTRGLHRQPVDPVRGIGDANARRGREAILRHGCGACHVIPGVPSARGRVGPKLEDFRNQMYISGVLMNTPENLTAWLRNPRDIDQRTAMPDLGISQEEADDIAAYLYTVP